MSTPELLYAAVVLLFGVPAALRNPTATGLVVAWVVVTAIWYAVPGGQGFMGDRVAEITLLMGLDAMVLTIVCAKSPRYNFRDIFREKSLWDRVVIACFPLIWTAYFLPTGSFRWWALWVLALAQLLASIGEPLENYRNRRAANATEADDPETPHSGAEYWVLSRVRGYG